MQSNQIKRQMEKPHDSKIQNVDICEILSQLTINNTTGSVHDDRKKANNTTTDRPHVLNNDNRLMRSRDRPLANASNHQDNSMQLRKRRRTGEDTELPTWNGANLNIDLVPDREMSELSKNIGLFNIPFFVGDGRRQYSTREVMDICNVRDIMIYQKIRQVLESYASK